MSERGNLLPSRYDDPFVRQNLPPASCSPDCRFDLPHLQFPPDVNAAQHILQSGISAGGPDRTAIIDGHDRWSFRELDERSNQIAQVLIDDLGLKSGNRVLLRAPNAAMSAAIWFAILKAGGVAVVTVPLLRAGEVAAVVSKAKVSHAFCDVALADDMKRCAREDASLQHVVYFGGSGEDPADLENRSRLKPLGFNVFQPSRDDAALIGFTSGTTGAAKGTIHFHRDVLAVCECMPRHILKPTPADVFAGTPPFAFTFGLGGLLLFPVRYGATAVLTRDREPANLLALIERHRVTILFTAATGYRSLLAHLEDQDISCLRVCVSSGEHLPAAVSRDWQVRTGHLLTEVLGSTEMLHAFIGAAGDQIVPGSPGKIIPGYEARVVDEDFIDVADDVPGMLLVRGPTGCRYLDDPRQVDQVHDGWTITGDLVSRDRNGYFRFAGRRDDMIVSAGYNISPMEVEDALLCHDAVSECVVAGTPDPDRGHIVTAVVVAAHEAPGDELTADLQRHVKAHIAPYKYPRKIIFVESLPRTATGKILRRDILHHIGKKCLPDVQA